MIKINPEEIKKILVIRKHNQIGDIVVSIPMFYGLKKTFPNSKITLLASKTNYKIPFQEINPYIDNFIILDRSTITNQIKLIRQLRQEKFDIAVIPSSIRFSTTSNVISFLSAIKYRVGVNQINNKKNKFAFLLNIKNNFDWQNKNQIFRNLEVVEQIGCELTISEVFDSYPKITEEENLEAKKLINEKFTPSKLLVGFHSGAGQIQNIWSQENFIELAKILYKKYNANFILTSGSTDEEVIKKIVSEFESHKIPFLHAENLRIKNLRALINQCDLFISNDTGVMHIAGMTDTILISLMTKGKVQEWTPIGKNKFYLSSPTNNINEISVDDVLTFSERIIKLIMYKKKST